MGSYYFRDPQQRIKLMSELTTYDHAIEFVNENLGRTIDMRMINALKQFLDRKTVAVRFCAMSKQLESDKRIVKSFYDKNYPDAAGSWVVKKILDELGVDVG